MENIFQEASVSPDVVLAGDSVEFTIRLVAGKNFSADGTRIIYDLPAYLGQDRPSVMGQEDGGFIRAWLSNPDIRYRLRNWDIEIEDFPTKTKQSFRGMAQRMVVLDLLAGQAAEGDEIILKWGYTRDGFGVGDKVSVLVLEPEFHNCIDIRYFADGERGLPDFGRSFRGYERPQPDAEVHLKYLVKPREPERVRAIVRRNNMLVKVLDRFSNICVGAEIAKFADCPEIMKQNSYGAWVSGNRDLSLTGKNLPLAVTPDMSGVFGDYKIYFGDIHTHSAFSNDCVEREKNQIEPTPMFAYGRHAAGLDFMAITDHHQPWDIERNKQQPEQWAALLEAVGEHHVPGEFLTFPGIEYRCQRGDTAVVFNEMIEHAVLDDPEMSDIRRLWEKLRGHDYLAIPHFHNGGSLEENEWWYCEEAGVEPVFEMFSCHGSYEVSEELGQERKPPMLKGRRPDRNITWMLEQGFRYGLCCNSDGHKGNPGSNGLMAVYSEELSRDAIFAAIRARRVYGTTNARIRVLFACGDALMGSELPADTEKKFHISVAGEQKIKAVDILRNSQIVKRFRPDKKEFTTDCVVDESGSGYYYLRVMQVDNHIAWSSPIWFA